MQKAETSPSTPHPERPCTPVLHLPTLPFDKFEEIVAYDADPLNAPTPSPTVAAYLEERNESYGNYKRQWELCQKWKEEEKAKTASVPEQEVKELYHNWKEEGKAKTAPVLEQEVRARKPWCELVPVGELDETASQDKDGGSNPQIPKQLSLFNPFPGLKKPNVTIQLPTPHYPSLRSARYSYAYKPPQPKTPPPTPSTTNPIIHPYPYPYPYQTSRTVPEPSPIHDPSRLPPPLVFPCTTPYSPTPNLYHVPAAMESAPRTWPHQESIGGSGVKTANESSTQHQPTASLTPFTNRKDSHRAISYSCKSPPTVFGNDFERSDGGGLNVGAGREMVSRSEESGTFSAAVNSRVRKSVKEGVESEGGSVKKRRRGGG